MQVFHATVIETVDLSTAMRRIVFGGPGLADYRSTGVGDEYIRLLFPEVPGEIPTLPAVIDGNLDYSSVDLSRLRTYTIRRFDAERRAVTVDFVVHEGGVAAAWAREARVGHVVGMNAPTGMYDPPPGLEWQILVADYAAVPAALRIAELRPGNTRTRLVLEIADESHQVDLPSRIGLEVRWIIGGNGDSPSRLEEIVRSLPLPTGTGYVWVAGESRVLRGVRKYLRHELGLPASAYKAVGYWVAEAERWHELYEALDPSIQADLEAMWAGPGDEEAIQDEYDERLTRLGL